MEGKSSTPNPKLLQRLQTEFEFNTVHIQNTLSLLLADNTIPFVPATEKSRQEIWMKCRSLTYWIDMNI